MAEIVQRRRENREIDVDAFFQKKAQPASIDLSGLLMVSGEGITETAQPEIEFAHDPICHMTVEIATAKYISEYESQKVYFCCAGCKATFDKAPANYPLDI